MISGGSLSIFVLLFIAVTSLVCILTGHSRRSYTTIPRSASLIIAGKTIELDKLATSFQPQLFQKPGDYSPPVLAMWWEAVDAGDSVALVYHPVWQDERHPVPLLHWIFYAYRAIVYGVPVRDIEYIQINISRADGLIQRVRYEASTAVAYDQPISEHIRITIDRSGAEYRETALLPDEASRVRTLRIAGSHLQFGIATWSHQLVLLEDDVGSYTVPMPMSLESLSEDNYAKHKLARRSQGDFATQEGIVGRMAKSVIRTVILGLPYILSKIRYAKPRVSGDGDAAGG